MRRRLSLFSAVIALCALVISVAAWTESQQGKPASGTPAPMDDLLQAVRGDLQTSRADIIKKSVTLTPEQGAKFWPLFDAYQKEQNAIMDEQLKAIQHYIEIADRADDAAALAFVNAHLTRDARMDALRQQWLGTFQEVLGARLAARVIQIDRRISLSQQMQLTSKIPLVR